MYDPTVLQLRNAGDVYPAWVTTHYLQLPDNISPEITALAQRITARVRTSYDMAVAITKYLRSNITYSNTVETPPAGQDPLDWFLFDSKKDSVITMPRLKSSCCAAPEFQPGW